ncbi:MAG: 30S ribosomal protein S14 [Gammaproteobacteria bacterium RBG_16_37_9]|nr:MAG: 30S ribosomal protein S14 [Gammaproteobacteria bacterium RBG_16_37_9]
MAKTCMIARESKRRRLVQNARVRRKELREVIKNPKTGFEEKMAAVAKLNKSPRNESAVRVRSRCQICGRPRAIYKKFGLCRIHLREAAMRGDVPGLVKASW